MKIESFITTPDFEMSSGGYLNSGIDTMAWMVYCDKRDIRPFDLETFFTWS